MAENYAGVLHHRRNARDLCVAHLQRASLDAHNNAVMPVPVLQLNHLLSGLRLTLPARGAACICGRACGFSALACAGLALPFFAAFPPHLGKIKSGTQVHAVGRAIANGSQRAKQGALLSTHACPRGSSSAGPHSQRCRERGTRGVGTCPQRNGKHSDLDGGGQRMVEWLMC